MRSTWHRQCLPAVSLLLVLMVLGCQQVKSEAAKLGGTARAATPKSATSPIERGKYLVTAMGCNDCHTPFKMGQNGPEPDMTRMLSGHPADLKMSMPALPPGWGFMANETNTAFAGPWGISYAANLTPDEETGIGAWDDALFIDAMRNGQYHGGGRPMLPPMPWQWIKALNDADLKAISAYLHSIPPIKNAVPEATPPAGVTGH